MKAQKEARSRQADEEERRRRLALVTKPTPKEVPPQPVKERRPQPPRVIAKSPSPGPSGDADNAAADLDDESKPNGFDRGLEVDEILGAAELRGKLHFLVRFKVGSSDEHWGMGIIDRLAST